MIKALSWLSLGCAAIPALLFLKNLRLYREPPVSMPSGRPSVSVLIPARNEERNIGAVLESILANDGVELEVVVLDDHSTDRTGAIVESIAARDKRVRLESAPDLPPDWCGKQHACWVLAQCATNPLLVFVDADVRLAPDSLGRFAAFVEKSEADLVSGVPRQITGTWMEKLLIPLIHFVLLGFLPLDRMRRDPHPAFGAGCGQLFVARRGAYFTAGGHKAIRASMHDGITLPRAFRNAGFQTDLFDATGCATCRMYDSAAAVWKGLEKNASEGLGSPRLIVPMTVLLFAGQVLPWILINADPARRLAWWAAGASIIPRVAAARRFDQSAFGAMLHPVGVIVLLMIQWCALLRNLAGYKPSWKGRAVAAQEP